MTSQPLETIPEEPTPTPAPTRVTADPPKTKPAKNPGRVASGKRLAERNRLAREAQKKAEAESANPAPTTTAASASDVTTTTANDNSSGLSLVAMLGIGGLIISAAGLYYQREAIMTRLKPAPPPPEPAKPAEPAPSRIPVKQGIKKWNNFKHCIYFHHGEFCERNCCRLCCFIDHTFYVLFQQSSSGNSVCYKRGNRKSPRACSPTSTPRNRICSLETHLQRRRLYNRLLLLRHLRTLQLL